MKQVDNKIIDKIRKMLALGQSPNENEAKLAIANAQRFLIKYNLTMSDIDVVESGVGKTILDDGKRASGWKTSLANALATHNYCEVIIQRWRGNRYVAGRFEYALIGKQHNVIVIQEMYKYLVDAIDNMAKKCPLKGARAKNSYRIGLVSGIQSRLQEIRNMVEKDGISDENGNQIKALVVQDLYKKEKEINNDFIRNEFGKLGAEKRRNNIDAGAYRRGINESQNINLNQQIR